MLTFAVAVVTGLILSLYLDFNWAEAIVLFGLWSVRGFLARSQWLDRVESVFGRFASRRRTCIALAFIVPIALRLSVLPWEPVPRPWVPDEFSHLLIADTLAHGRLANPTHPLWQHFETIHVFFEPAYASPYFPGLGGMMAAGKLFGHYWMGVLLAGGAMCAALLWMLYGWFPPRWAVLGAILAILRWGAISYWINSYWGGSLAAIGGALVFGAYARIMRGGRRTWAASAVLGVGLVILIFTRPLEGAIICAPVAIALLLRRISIPALVPAGVMVSIAIFTLGVYDKAVTGDAWRVPYRVNQQLYGWPLGLPFQHSAPVAYRNVEMRLYYEYECGQRDLKSSAVRAVEFAAVNLSPSWRFYLGPALTLALIWSAAWWKSRRMRLPLVCSAVACILALMLGAYPHYIAPALGCFLIVIIHVLRNIRRVDAAGLVRSRIIIAACLLIMPVRAFVDPSFLPETLPGHHVFSTFGSEKGRERARIVEKLERIPGRHVVFARYHRERYTITEWVYNSADIDAQKVVWARDLGRDKNREVLQYYPDRKAWIVNVDDAPGRLLPYGDTPAEVKEARP